jgi:hypothetical protein
MKKIYTLKLMATSALLFVAINLTAQLETVFEYTGGMQSFTVPADVFSIYVEAWGAQGQALTIEDYDGSVGGLGGYAAGALSVTPGDVLYIFVGGTGVEGEASFNGGGIGGYGTPSDGDAGNAGSGGGASDIRVGGTTLADRVLVAGGGGGGGRDYVNGTCQPCGTGGDGGVGGGIVGGDGDDPWYASSPYINPGSGGSGGSDVAGGAGGDGPEGIDGNPGTLGVGGDGIPGNYSVASGGGGGGYYGGGAGAGANSGSGVAGGGGAGGSSYIGGVIDGETEAGVRSGHGRVIITEYCELLSLTISSDTVCFGFATTITAESLSGGDITWDGGITNGVPFIPEAVGTYTYVATSSDEDDCPATAEIVVLELPEVVANAAPTDVCLGNPLLLYGSGAETYFWDPATIVDGEVIYPDEAGIFNYTVIGFDEFGCGALNEVEVTIHDVPEITATADRTKICLGDAIVFNAEGGESYSWDPDIESGEPVVFDEAGVYTYEVEGEDEFGCENSATIDVEVFDPIEVTYDVSEELFGDDGAINITVTGGMPGYTFDWDNDGTGDYDDDEDLLDVPGGTYVVSVKDESTCEMTLEFTVGTQLSIDDFTNLPIQIFPNPTNDRIQINLEGYFDYTIFTVDGRRIANGSGANSTMVDLSDWAAGTYYVNILRDETIKVYQVVKQ